MAKRNDPTDIWAWIENDKERLLQKGGQQKAILENYYDFWRNYDSDYVAAEIAISQALEAAHETNEVKWQLHLRHWRIQLWLKQRQTRRALPEAVDLLSLATDRQVRDVPQRICAFHDIVECYVNIDPAGYHDDIVANSQDVLAQLPKQHPCATCARFNLAHTAAAIGDAKDAEYWMNQVNATLNERLYNALTLGLGRNYILLGKWDDAERYYLRARDVAQKERKRGDFIKATLSLVRVYLGKENRDKALDMLQNGRQNMKFQSHPADLAQLAEVEGYMAVELQRIPQALEHMTRAARLYLDLGCYRDGALTALYAAESARATKTEVPEKVLDLAAQAVGQLPPTSQDLYQRLATFNRQPVAPSIHSQELTSTTAQEQDQKELHTLQDLLQEHVTQRHFADVSMTLYRLAIWYGGHEQIRAAVDYLIAEAALERLLMMPSREREDALKTLRRLRRDLPDGTVEAALTAAQSGPSSWIQSLFPDIAFGYWRWILRGIEAEIADRPFVEPEPLSDEQDRERNFQDWLNHSGSMTSLILRFSTQCDPQEFEPWIEAMDETAEDIASHNNGAPEAEVVPILNLVRGLAALARGSSVAEVTASVPPPFTDVIIQIVEIAQSPVWFHPEATPIDFLVEQAAQKAVRTLCHYDKERTRRLKNLALRYKLMAIDLRAQEQLVPMAHFLDALRELVLSEGKQLPMLTQPLEAPFDVILAAVFEQGQQTKADPREEKQA